MRTAAQRGLCGARQDYEQDRITADELEVEVAFWLAVEACQMCDNQMCSAHYTKFSGR